MFSEDTDHSLEFHLILGPKKPETTMRILWENVTVNSYATVVKMTNACSKEHLWYILDLKIIFISTLLPTLLCTRTSQKGGQKYAGSGEFGSCLPKSREE